MESINQTIIEAQVIEALRTCFDPEIPVNIYEMGLIYEVKVDEKGAVTIQMTLTSPSCPAAQSIPAEVEQKVRAIDGVTDVQIDLVWEPPWDQNKMSEAARLQLGML
jgi:FeS assembly SUF system protein